MPKYIDAETVLEMLVYDDEHEECRTEKDTIENLLDSFTNEGCPMPAADVVEVVRCKDCKFYGRADKRRFYRGYDCLEGRIASIVPDKDFCSRAERREETI